MKNTRCNFWHVGLFLSTRPNRLHTHNHPRSPIPPLATLTSRATHAHPTSPRSTGFSAIWDCTSSSSSSINHQLGGVSARHPGLNQPRPASLAAPLDSKSTFTLHLRPAPVPKPVRCRHTHTQGKNSFSAVFISSTLPAGHNDSAASGIPSELSRSTPSALPISNTTAPSLLSLVLDHGTGFLMGR